MRFYQQNIVLTLTLVVAIYSLFYIKYEVANMQQQNHRVASELSLEEDMLKVLKAEWSYLNTPKRLREMVSRHLELNPIELGQISNPVILSASNTQQAG
ncbi:MAG: hypothetical protein AAF153_01780 [Pseudomonadota bacterium]